MAGVDAVHVRCGLHMRCRGVRRLDREYWLVSTEELGSAKELGCEIFVRGDCSASPWTYVVIWSTPVLQGDVYAPTHVQQPPVHPKPSGRQILVSWVRVLGIHRDSVSWVRVGVNELFILSMIST